MLKRFAVAMLFMSFFSAIAAGGAMRARCSPSPSCYGWSERSMGIGTWTMYCSEGEGCEGDPITGGCKCSTFVLSDGWFTDYQTCTCGGGDATTNPGSLLNCYGRWEEGVTLDGWFHNFMGCHSDGCRLNCQKMIPYKMRCECR